MSCCVPAVFAFSSYSIFMFFFPFLAPVIRRLAMIFPDKGLLRQKHNRKVIVDTVSGLIEQHRATLANEVSNFSRQRLHASVLSGVKVVGSCCKHYPVATGKQ